ncbi:hypothetical protein BGW36DRAFT_385440 [Talaromyces proteolyticus]|uniref:Uncharacterized protein n=1 Tax=Talaromyces proteolyticus TaxID=1131652 RepID=A0AAD4KPY3_9EURO|nr:uncharacterized protein BGW36DRAFT_385440 [Talaromyces proteolyticus]KAH8692904.1 hypothetical protein BGW36DRAFT_385440 [Talaromyces proteolyticus]
MRGISGLAGWGWLFVVSLTLNIYQAYRSCFTIFISARRTFYSLCRRNRSPFVPRATGNPYHAHRTLLNGNEKKKIIKAWLIRDDSTNASRGHHICGRYLLQTPSSFSSWIFRSGRTSS